MTDPNENVNVNQDPDYADVIEEMYELLRRGWRGVVRPDVNIKSSFSEQFLASR